MRCKRRLQQRGFRGLYGDPRVLPSKAKVPGGERFGKRVQRATQIYLVSQKRHESRIRAWPSSIQLKAGHVLLLIRPTCLKELVDLKVFVPPELYEPVLSALEEDQSSW